VIHIDGQLGEGGGQVLRSALCLSMLTGRPLTINDIRGRRAKPGLLRQHLTAVQAACEVSDAQVLGAHLGSHTLVFRPKAVRHGEYHFAVGTAGSAPLVLQTVLCALLAAPGESRLVLEGGTHNPLAPTFDCLAVSYFPLLRLMGAQLRTELITPGFYPAGGGKFVVDVQGGKTLTGFDLTARGPLLRTHCEATLCDIPKHVAERELAVLTARLGHLNPSSRINRVQSLGPGNVVSTYLHYASFTTTLVAFGEKRRSAEKVANELVDETSAYVSSDAAIDTHAADQLLLPLALAGGGQFSTLPPSLHFTTNAAVIAQFLPVNIQVARPNPERNFHLVTVSPS
jgi:RNA 3'-terminal phosphate cyclase (ATP)